MILNILNKVSTVAISIILLIIGILFIINYESFWFIIYIFITIYFSINIINKIINKKFNLAFIIDFIGIYILIFHRVFYFNLIYVLLGWWLLLNAFILFVESYISKKDSLDNTLSNLLKAIFNTLLGTTLILGILKSPIILSNTVGIYLIIISIIELINFLIDVLPLNIKSKISLSMPIILSMLVPSRAYVSIDKLIKQNKVIPNDKVSNNGIEILIHVKKEGNESIGHVDVAIDNYVYSYGLHDPNSRKLYGTLGDGVLFKVDKQSFLKQGIHQEDKMIISYTLNTTENQLEIIKNRLSKLLENTYSFKSQAQIFKEENKPYNSYVDYASRVYRFTNAKMFKFRKGKFKTYFVATTNCVLLSDYLVRSNELNLIKVNGIVTPGTYLQFLTNDLINKNGVVNNFTIYYKQDDKYTIKRYNGLSKSKDYISIRKQVLQEDINTKFDEISTHIVIYDSNTPIGTGRIYQDELNNIHIDNIYVLNDYLDKNIESIIIKELSIISKAWKNTKKSLFT